MSGFQLGDRVHDGMNYGVIVQIEPRDPPLYLVSVQLWPREKPICTWRRAEAIQHEDEYWARVRASNEAIREAAE